MRMLMLPHVMPKICTSQSSSALPRCLLQTRLWATPCKHSGSCASLLSSNTEQQRKGSVPLCPYHDVGDEDHAGGQYQACQHRGNDYSQLPPGASAPAAPAAGLLRLRCCQVRQGGRPSHGQFRAGGWSSSSC